MEGGRWLGHDRYRDLPMLGVDPEFKSDWEPIDDGRRPDNSDPRTWVTQPYGTAMVVGDRPDIGHLDRDASEVSEPDPDEGRALMEYHRRLAMMRDAHDVVIDSVTLT